jgi:hypothetical protein
MTFKSSVRGKLDCEWCGLGSNLWEDTVFSNIHGKMRLPVKLKAAVVTCECI